MRSNQRRAILLALVLSFAFLFLAGCGGQVGGGPAPAVEAYIQALTAKDADKLAQLSCKEWEEQARMEMDSFQAVKTSLEGMTCKEESQDSAGAVVSCQGKIVMTYSTDTLEINLADRDYRLAQQNGEWLVCGYQ